MSTFHKKNNHVEVGNISGQVKIKQLIEAGMR